MEEGLRIFCENPTCPDPLITTKRPLKCAQCKRLYYCSKECQKLHWKQHKPECKDPETLTILDVGLFPYKKCPRTDQVGPHKHGMVYASSEQYKKAAELVLPSIFNLPPDPDYRLSCACNVQISHYRGQYSIVFGATVNEFTYVFMRCANSKCEFSSERPPLLMLEHLLNFPKQQVFGAIPYLEHMSGTNYTIINFNCKELEEYPYKDRLVCERIAGRLALWIVDNGERVLFKTECI